MNYKFFIYNEDGEVVSYGETNTPIENISSDLGNAVEVENFDEVMEEAPTNDN